MRGKMNEMSLSPSVALFIVFLMVKSHYFLLAFVINLSIVITLFNIWICFLSTYYPDKWIHLRDSYGFHRDHWTLDTHLMLMCLLFMKATSHLYQFNSNTMHSIQIESTNNWMIVSAFKSIQNSITISIASLDKFVNRKK